MNDFSRCNKTSGIHWLKKSIKDLKIKIRLKPQDGIISLPKFEDYKNGSNSLKLQSTAVEHILKWQEKIFCLWEVQRYSDINNCITDTELNYHDMVENLQNAPSKIFTYIQDDRYLPLPLDCKKKNNGLLNLNVYMEQLSLNETVRNWGKMFGGSSSAGHLFQSEENLVMEKEEWMAMHVMFDNSDYNEDTQLIFKHEEILLSIYHNLSKNYLIVTPDVNNLELNPYTLEAVSGGPWGYQYAVEMEFTDAVDSEELAILLKKVNKRWEKKQKYLLNFIMPPLGKKQYYIVIEILKASGFDMDNLYIDYDIKLPEDVACVNNLSGKTHTSEAHSKKDYKEWTFGQLIEFCVEINSGIDAQPLKLFLEVISTDWWGRHRTEGYSYLPLTLDPGGYTKKLPCRRPQETDAVEADSRRFFLGGCHLIKDLNVLAEPQSQDTNFTFVSTGSIYLRWNIIKHQCIGVTNTEYLPHGSGSTASALLLGADSVLSKYNKARSKLALATRLVTGT